MKKVFCLLLCFCIVSTFAFAHDSVQSPDIAGTDEKELDTFIAFINDFYIDQTEKKYEIIGYNGININEQIKNQTQSMVASGDWFSVSEYFKENVDLMSYETISYQSNKGSRGLDVSKTVKKHFSDYLTTTDESGNKWTVEAQFAIVGTIFYDPNTFVVSSGNMYLSDFYPSSGSIDSTQEGHSLTKYSATFNATVTYKRPPTSPSTYPSLSGSLTVTAG